MNKHIISLKNPNFYNTREIHDLGFVSSHPLEKFSQGIRPKMGLK